jgi:hypothetical protein
MRTAIVSAASADQLLRPVMTQDAPLHGREGIPGGPYTGR